MTHVPGSSESIQYDDTLRPGSPVTGSIGWSNPDDGYDWFCTRVTSGTEITLTATRTSGDIRLNLGILQGVANNGDPRSVLMLLTNTNNSSTPDVTLTYTPSISGPITVFVSTWLNEVGGGYQLAMTGGFAETCSATQLSVRFEWLRAIRTPAGGAIVTWQTAEENSTVGFDLLRGESLDPALASVIIASPPSHGPYRTYTAPDAEAPQGAMWYFVREWTLDGPGDFSPPLRLAPVEPAAAGARSRGKAR